MKPQVSVVVTAYNEGEAIVPCLDRILTPSPLPCEVLVVFDSPDDTTAPWVEKYNRDDPRVVPVLNPYGRGPARAIRFGFDHAAADVVVVTMADGCDDPMQIDPLARLVERGVVIAAASRYMRGGRQIGGPLVKSALSRMAGISLHLLARVGTRDATNSFKAYSAEFVRQVGIESDEGFEVGLELVAKARRHRLPVAEIPTIWLDRASGQSNFKLRKWLPRYLRWYFYAFGPKLPVEEVAARDPARCLPEPRAPRDRTSAAGSLDNHEECVLMAKVLVSGSAGFIGGYVVEELLRRGHQVVGIDNLSKYGKVAKSYDDDPGYRFVEGDCRDVDLMTKLLSDCDHFIAGAAMIGGISYFHTYAYDLLATNERIIAASCDAAIAAHRAGRLEKVTYLSSSMVFESPTHGPPTRDRSTRSRRRSRPTASRSWRSSTSPGPPTTSTGCPTPSCGRSTAWESGSAGRWATSRSCRGTSSLAMSHVVPDLVQKVLKGQDPLHILGDGSQVRHYTYGGDLAAGIVTAMEHPDALNEDFNLSTAPSTTVLELAETIWRKIRRRSRSATSPIPRSSTMWPGGSRPPRRPSVCSASRPPHRSSEMLDEVIPWITRAVEDGTI